MTNDLGTFERLESEVRSYCRSWPVLFHRAEGHHLFAKDGTRYLDFFAGAGALNYGHNNPVLRDALVEYIANGGIIHSLDMATTAKEEFLETLDARILRPRGMEWKVQFPGPTGTNAVEAALKLARKATGRQNVVGFTNAFHGMTLGSLAVTGNAMKRGGAGLLLPASTSMPYDGFLGEDGDTLDYFRQFLEGGGSGLDLPAAVILETIQAEGGINAADFLWLRRLEELCRAHGMLLIVDDIQVGCGRTGPFFSFERAGISPDIVCLSKSLSGFGLPMAITLLKPELDVWEPGEHNGTFRGNNAAFVTATAALNTYWQSDALTLEVESKAAIMKEGLERIMASHPFVRLERRGRGMLQGIKCTAEGLAQEVTRQAFDRKLVIETSGPSSEVVKLLPSLTISQDGLAQGLDILADSFSAAISARKTLEPAGSVELR